MTLPFQGITKQVAAKLAALIATQPELRVAAASALYALELTHDTGDDSDDKAIRFLQAALAEAGPPEQGGN